MADSRYFGIGLDNSQLKRQIEEAKKSFRNLSDEALKQAGIIDGAFSGKTLSMNIEKEFKKINKMSIDLFGGLSENTKRAVTEMQEDITTLSNVEKMMSGLNKAYEDGTISQNDYIKASARLTVLHQEISKAIQANEKALREENQMVEKLADDSMLALQQRIALLTTEYMRFSEAQRRGVAGEEQLKKIADLQTKLQQAQATMQQYGAATQRTFNGLGFSIQQIAKELPSLAMGPQMFFLAISNNLPIFTDELARARKEYQLLTEAGKSATPVWKQVISSLFSWQTALSALPAVLVVLGPQIAEFFQSFFTGKEKIDSATEALENINKELESSNANYGANVVTLRTLSEEYKKLTDDKSRLEWIKENKSEFDKLGISVNDLSDAEKAFVNDTADVIEAFRLRAYAAAAQKLAEEKYSEAIQKRHEAELLRAKADETRNKGEINATGYMQDTRYGTQLSASKLVEERAKGFEAEAKAADKSADAIEKNANAYYDLYSAKKIAASKKLEELGLDSSGINSIEKKTKKLKDYTSELQRIRDDNEDRAVESIKDGTERQLAEINLRYDRELAAVKKLQENLKKQQGGKLTTEQQGLFDNAIAGIGVARKRDTSKVEDDKIKAQEKAWNEYLAKYGDYQQKRKAIAEKYSQEIAEASTAGEAAMLTHEMNDALAQLDDEAQKKTSVITRLFADMSKKSVEQMRAISDEAERFLSFIESGEYQQDNAFGITKEQFEVLKQSPEKLESIKNEVANVRNEADKAEPTFERIGTLLNNLFKGGDKNETEEWLEQLNQEVGKVMRSVQFLSDTFSDLADAFGSDVLGGIAEGFNVINEAANKALSGGLAGFMIGGPIGAGIGATVGLVGSLVSSIAKIHDKKNEKQIQKLQDQIDALDRSYEKLGSSIEKAYSKDASKMIEQQNTLLEQQKVLIQQQIREEQDKKKSDENRIKEWQQQIEDINSVIEENKEKAVDAIFGEDLKSAIDNFANAYVDAWSQGEDKAISAKDTVKKMMQQMVTESIKMAIQSSKSMEEIRKKLQQFYADNVLTGWEQDYIYNMADELQKELDKQFGWANSLFGSDKAQEQQSATSKGFETMSQEQAGELNGRFTALYEVALQNSAKIDLGNVNLEAIKNHARETKDMVQTCIQHLEEIRDNTGAIVEPIMKMQKDIEVVKQNTARL